MSTEKLIETLEKYSSATVGFIILQAISFSTLYGTNIRLNCLINTKRLLASGLMLHFALSTILGCIAIAALSNAIQRISSTDHLQIFRGIYWAKIIMVLLFAAMPIILISAYGFTYTQGYAVCVQP